MKCVVPVNCHGSDLQAFLLRVRDRIPACLVLPYKWATPASENCPKSSALAISYFDHS